MSRSCVRLLLSIVVGGLCCVNVDAQIRERFDLADASVGGDGSLPGTGATSAMSTRPARGAFRVVKHAAVDGVFGPSAKDITQISSTGLEFDFSKALGVDTVNSAPANGPAGTVQDPSGRGKNPNYGGDTKHSFLEMHACIGITYDLDGIRKLFGRDVAIERFTTVAGSQTPATTNYWVLVDARQRAHGTIEGRGSEPIDLRIRDEDRFLSLVVGDGGKKTINNAHAYFGDPFLSLSGPRPKTAPRDALPTDGAAGVPAWMPLSWNRQIGIQDYEVTLWNSEDEEPKSPTVTVHSTRFVPDKMLRPAMRYSWRVSSRLPSGTLLRGIVRSFTTQKGTTQSPPFDLSPAAQRKRAQRYAISGIDALCASDSPLKDGMRIALFGDSITDNTQYQRSIVKAVTKKRPGVVFLNRGINGGKAEDLVLGIRRYNAGGGQKDPESFVEHLAKDKPNLVVVYVGVNESNNYRAKDGIPASPPTSDTDFRKHLTTMVRAARTKGIPVVLATPSVHGEKPDGSNRDDEHLDRLSAMTRAVAKQEGVTLVDLREAFLAWLQNHNFHIDNAGAVSFPSSRGLLTGDGVHPNAHGSRLTAELIADGIVRALAPRK